MRKAIIIALFIVGYYELQEFLGNGIPKPEIYQLEENPTTLKDSLPNLLPDTQRFLRPQRLLDFDIEDSIREEIKMEYE